MQLDMLIGSGGVLSHAPRRWQTAAMLIDSYLPCGITQLAVDSIFMMPQLGVLSSILPEAAAYVFEKDCLIELGTCIAPVYTNGRPLTEGTELLEVNLNGQGSFTLHAGELRAVALGKDKTVSARLQPLHQKGGVAGLIFDGRGRQPFELPSNRSKLISKLKEWQASMAAAQTAYD